MKVVSYNVRGLGGLEKRSEVRRLVQEKNPFVLCIQESKLGVVDDYVIKAIWGDTPYGYSFQSSVGAFGGLITVWNNSLLDVWSTSSFDHVLVIIGRVISTGDIFVIINVYAPCDSSEKRRLWERLSPFVLSKSELCVCLCGDFNCVRSEEERKGRGLFLRQLCYTLILDLKILIQIPLLFSNTFKSTVFSTVLQLHTLLFQSFEFLHKIIQKGILVISYKGTHFQSLHFVAESFLFAYMNH